MENLIIVGVDPGTGISSPTGMVIFNPNSCDIIFAEELSSTSKTTEHKVKDICGAFEAILMIELDKYVNRGWKVVVVFENFVMRGKGGQVLQRLIGALVSRVPKDFEVIHVYNTTVKKQVGGTGRADKEQVADGVIHYFRDHDESWRSLRSLKTNRKFDLLDAFAIG